MKKIISIIIITAVLLSTALFPTSAAIPPQLYGDVFNDTNIDIIDATCVQKYLAKSYDLRRSHHEGADVDGDNVITIIDATCIQLYIANIITEFPAGKYYFIDKQLYDVVPSFLSGKAMVGVPVDFEVEGYAYPNPSKASLYVNGELVDTAIDSDIILSYTFEEVGVYEILVTLADKWGYQAGSRRFSYQVVEPVTDTSKPVITNIAITETYYIEPIITVDAMYGSGDYTYSYYIRKSRVLEEDRVLVYSRENIKENSIKIDDGSIIYYEVYTVTVVVTDSNGNTAEETTSFRCEDIPPA